MVVNDSILPLISDEANRDRVSSRGWAFGYLGGGLLLAVNLAVVTLLPFGLTTGRRRGICMLSAAIWWAGFTIIPFVRLSNHPPVQRGARRGQRRGPQLRPARGDAARHAQLPDGADVPRSPTCSSTTASRPSSPAPRRTAPRSSATGSRCSSAPSCSCSSSRSSGRCSSVASPSAQGAKKTILMGLVIWMVIVTAALFLPAGNVALFMVFGVAVGIVLGGTQALARSYFSLLIPRGKEAEYFSFYHAMDRGTSWFGTLVFGLVVPVHRLLPAGDLRAHRVLPHRRLPAHPRRHRARHPRRRQRAFPPWSDPAPRPHPIGWVRGRMIG